MAESISRSLRDSVSLLGKYTAFALKRRDTGIEEGLAYLLWNGGMLPNLVEFILEPMHEDRKCLSIAVSPTKPLTVDSFTEDIEANNNNDDYSLPLPHLFTLPAKVKLPSSLSITPCPPGTTSTPVTPTPFLYTNPTMSHSQVSGALSALVLSSPGPRPSSRLRPRTSSSSTRRLASTGTEAYLSSPKACQLLDRRRNEEQRQSGGGGRQMCTIRAVSNGAGVRIDQTFGSVGGLEAGSDVSVPDLKRVLQGMGVKLDTVTVIKKKRKVQCGVCLKFLSSTYLDSHKEKMHGGKNDQDLAMAVDNEIKGEENVDASVNVEEVQEKVKEIVIEKKEVISYEKGTQGHVFEQFHFEEIKADDYVDDVEKILDHESEQVEEVEEALRGSQYSQIRRRLKPKVDLDCEDQEWFDSENVDIDEEEMKSIMSEMEENNKVLKMVTRSSKKSKMNPLPEGKKMKPKIKKSRKRQKQEKADGKKPIIDLSSSSDGENFVQTKVTQSDTLEERKKILKEDVIDEKIESENLGTTSSRELTVATNCYVAMPSDAVVIKEQTKLRFRMMEMDSGSDENEEVVVGDTFVEKKGLEVPVFDIGEEGAVVDKGGECVAINDCVEGSVVDIANAEGAVINKLGVDSGAFCTDSGLQLQGEIMKPVQSNLTGTATVSSSGKRVAVAKCSVCEQVLRQNSMSRHMAMHARKEKEPMGMLKRKKPNKEVRGEVKCTVKKGKTDKNETEIETIAITVLNRTIDISQNTVAIRDVVVSSVNDGGGETSAGVVRAKKSAGPPSLVSSTRGTPPGPTIEYPRNSSSNCPAIPPPVQTPDTADKASSVTKTVIVAKMPPNTEPLPAAVPTTAPTLLSSPHQKVSPHTTSPAIHQSKRISFTMKGMGSLIPSGHGRVFSVSMKPNVLLLKGMTAFGDKFGADLKEIEFSCEGKVLSGDQLVSEVEGCLVLVRSKKEVVELEKI